MSILSKKSATKTLIFFQSWARKKWPHRDSKHADNLYGFQVSGVRFQYLTLPFPDTLRSLQHVVRKRRLSAYSAAFQSFVIRHSNTLSVEFLPVCHQFIASDRTAAIRDMRLNIVKPPYLDDLQQMISINSCSILRCPGIFFRWGGKSLNFLNNFTICFVDGIINKSPHLIGRSL